MKPNRVLLTAASAIFSAQVMAGQAVFYVTEDGSAVRDLAVAVDGQKKLVSSSGFDSGAPLWLWVVGYDGPPTDYRVDLVLR